MEHIKSRSFILLLKLLIISIIAGGLIMFLNAWPELWPVIGFVAAYKSVELFLKEVKSMINESRATVESS